MGAVHRAVQLVLATWLALTCNGFEKFIGPAEQRIVEMAVSCLRIRWVGGEQRTLAMLANHTATKIFNADLKASAARRALLDEISRIRHHGTSCWRTAIQNVSCEL
jgi:hypothetical protein